MGGEVRHGRLASADIAEKSISHRPLPIYIRGLYNFARNALAPNKFRAVGPIFDTVIAHVLHLPHTMDEFEYYAAEAFPQKVTQQPCFFMEQPEPDHLAELLGVLTVEDLIRFRHRLKKAGKPRTAEVLADEIRRPGKARVQG